MVEDWKKALDNRNFVGAILMDLSKAFDCFPHDLFLGKMKKICTGDPDVKPELPLLDMDDLLMSDDHDDQLTISMSDVSALDIESLNGKQDSVESLNPQVYSCKSKTEGTCDDESDLPDDISEEDYTGVEWRSEEDYTGVERRSEEDDTGVRRRSLSKLKRWLNSWWMWIMTIIYRVGNMLTSPLKPIGVQVKASKEFRDMVKKFVKTRLYGFTVDVEAVIKEFLQENGKLPAAYDFHLTWATMRGTKGIVRLQEEKEIEKREKEAEERKRMRLEVENEAERRQRMRLEEENEAGKREKEAEKRKRMRLERDIEEERLKRRILEQELLRLRESMSRSINIQFDI